MESSDAGALLRWQYWGGGHCWRDVDCVGVVCSERETCAGDITLKIDGFASGFDPTCMGCSIAGASRNRGHC